MSYTKHLSIRLAIILLTAALFTVTVGKAVFSQAGANAFLPIVAGQQDEGEDDYAARERHAIDLVVNQPDVADFLATLSGWTTEAYPEEDTWVIWKVDLYAAGESWTGYGRVNVVTGAVLEYFVPRMLPPDEYQAGLAAVEFFINHDAEISARLGTPELWDHYIDYDVWEQAWTAWFEYGLDNWYALFYVDGDNVYLDEMNDPEALEAAEQDEMKRNRAIDIAWRAEAIDQALTGVDNWRTYVEHQGDAVYSVEFVGDDVEYFYALVDIDAETILESQP